jgi:hypothetical protein
MKRKILTGLGKCIAKMLAKPIHQHRPNLPVSQSKLIPSLKIADVLLVEGESRVSNYIKYLTQSNWSHAALYVGIKEINGVEVHAVVEADIEEGVRLVAIDQYFNQNLRICRPMTLTNQECSQVVQFALERVGIEYDLKNIIDLARYLLPTSMIAPFISKSRTKFLGSGEPSKAICSTLIAQAFQSIKYPILPILNPADHYCQGCVNEIFNVRHYSLFVPKDFDLSPYFQIVKPNSDLNLDYKNIKWNEEL